MIIPILLILLFLCWGSFLNVIAYRLIKEESLMGRSRCIHCRHQISWYDNIPLVSYMILGGKCRTCHAPISFLYPLIEGLTTLAMVLLYYYIDGDYFVAYFLLFSSLIITIRTDIETMLISRFVILPLIPLGFIFSCSDHIPIIPLDSLMGAAIGYFSLWLISTLFYMVSGKEGIGDGDFELLALIGSFTGIFGVWVTLTLGSILGTLIGLTYLLATGTLKRYAQVPFGPFLALATIIYILSHEYILALLEW